jgi:putative NADH-flavin reductase
MRITVFGSTGSTGRLIILAALDAGHNVTAAARRPSEIGIAHERLDTVQADVLDPSSLDGACNGTDAVISAIGARQNRPTTIYSAGVANLLETMRGAQVQRLVCISAMPLTPRSEVGPFERRIVYPLLYRFFGEVYSDMARMEQTLRNSDVDWTTLRPPRLTDKAATGSYRTAINGPLARARTISRADLAAAVVQALDDPSAMRATVAIAN